MRLRGDKNQKTEKIDRNVQHSDRLMGLVVTNFVQIGIGMFKMILHLLKMFYHGVNNALKNRVQNKKSNRDDQN